MAASVGFFLERYPPAEMRDGDVYVTNDPWHGTGHLFDFTAVTPTFRAGRPVALFACTVHVVDIGGLGFGPDAGQVYEEGLCIPIMPLFERGEASQPLLAILRANVREPDQVVGDLYSLAACNEIGGRRLVEMMDEFALDSLDEAGDHIVETSRAAMLAEIAKLTAGVYDNEMTVDGFDRPVRLAARMTVAADGITVDFDGSSPVSPYGINVPLTYTQAYASFGIRCIVGAAIPNNAGSLAPIQVRAPAGSILNARSATWSAKCCPTWFSAVSIRSCPAKYPPRAAPACGTPCCRAATARSARPTMGTRSPSPSRSSTRAAPARGPARTAYRPPLSPPGSRTRRWRSPKRWRR
jgi:N-methylhydantoinase B